jgi:hypothetical protein
MSGICGSAQAAGALGRPPPLGGHFTTNIFFAELTSYHHRRFQLRWWPLPNLPLAPLGARHRRLQLRWWPLPDLPPATPRGPAIDVSNSDGGHCRTCRQQPPGGPPSTSPTSVVAAAGPAASTPQGAHHRCLQLRWWPLSDLPPATPRGAAIDVSNSGGGRCRTCRQQPPGGPPSTSPTPVVAAAEPSDCTP